VRNHDFKEPEYYWDIAEKYIIKKSKELKKDGKYYLDKDLAYDYIMFGSAFRHTTQKVNLKDLEDIKEVYSLCLKKMVKVSLEHYFTY